MHISIRHRQQTNDYVTSFEFIKLRISVEIRETTKLYFTAILNIPNI